MDIDQRFIDFLKSNWIKYHSAWNISEKLHTKTKIDLYKRIIFMWITVWNRLIMDWKITEDLVIIDFFAWRWIYFDENYLNIEIWSPLVYLHQLQEKNNRHPKTQFKWKLHLYLFEENKKNANCLFKIMNFFKDNYLDDDLKNRVEFKIINADSNLEVDNILSHISTNFKRSPLFIFIDPYWIKWNKENMDKILKLSNITDIFFNYMKMWVDRVCWSVKTLTKKQKQEEYWLFPEIWELIVQKKWYNVKKLSDTAKEFFGCTDEEVLSEEINYLDYYIENFKNNGYHVASYPMKYPNRDDELYYLLYFCRNPKIINDVVLKFYKDSIKKYEKAKAFNKNPHMGESLF